MSQQKQYRDLNLNDTITVEIPVAEIMSFVAEYISCQTFTATAANSLCMRLQKAILDPIFINEREALLQQQADQQEAFAQSFFTGKPPEVPPHMDMEP
jgi:hypothetical protein